MRSRGRTSSLSATTSGCTATGLRAGSSEQRAAPGRPARRAHTGGETGSRGPPAGAALCVVDGRVVCEWSRTGGAVVDGRGASECHRESLYNRATDPLPAGVLRDCPWRDGFMSLAFARRLLAPLLLRGGRERQAASPRRSEPALFHSHSRQEYAKERWMTGSSERVRQKVSRAVAHSLRKTRVE